MEQEYKYLAFISYRHNQQDSEIAKALHRQIENYIIPSSIKKTFGQSKMGRVFRDQDELPTSTNLGDDIDAALMQSKWLIVICSPDLIKSKWCMKEIDRFIALGRQDNILTLLVSGEPEESFPPQLRFVIKDGVTVEIEPLAAEVRAASRGERLKKLKVEKLRIIAPMLSVGFDDLRQRTRERKLRTLAAVGLGAALLLASFSLYAIQQNQLIAQQRNRSLNNEMLLLIEKSNLASLKGDKLGGIVYALDAYDAALTLHKVNEEALFNALESAAYSQSFEKISIIKTNNMHISNLTYSPNNRLILGIVNGNSAIIIDAFSGEMLFSVNENKEILNKVEFSPDGKYFLTACYGENSISVWNTPDGTFTAKYKSDSEISYTIASAYFLANSKQLILKEEDRIVIYDFLKDEKSYRLEGLLADKVSLYTSVTINDETTLLAIGTDFTNELMVYDINQDELKPLAKGDTGSLELIRFSPSGRYLTASSWDNVIVWEYANGIIMQQFVNDTRNISQLLFSSDEKQLAIASTEGVKLMDLTTGDKIWSIGENLYNQIYRIRFSENGKYLLALNTKIAVHDVATGMLLTDLDGINVLDAVFDSASTSILVSLEDGSFATFSTPEGSSVKLVDSYEEKLFSTNRNNALSVGNVKIISEHQIGPMYQIANSMMCSSPDGNFVALAHGDGFIEIWDVRIDDTPLSGIAEHYNIVTDMVFSNGLLASSSRDGRVLIYDIENEKVRFIFPIGKEVTNIEFSNDGSKLIALCNECNTAYVYSTTSGAMLFQLLGKDIQITSVGFTESGDSAVAKRQDGSAIVGKLYQTLDELIEQAHPRVGQ